MSDLALHATALVVGETGILVRGPSGAGKSTLALRLVAAAQAEGGFAALVGDDRVLVRRCHGRLVARPHPAIAGRVEIRGVGIEAVPFEPAAVIRLVVDLADDAPRCPEAADTVVAIDGIELPRLVVNRALALDVTTWRLRGKCGTGVTVR